MSRFRMLLLCLAVGTLLVAPAAATNLTWTGSGSSGSDPLGHDWVLLNTGPGGNAVVGIPGNGLGITPWLGDPFDFVTDFHFHTNDAEIVQTLPGTGANLTTFFHDDSSNGDTVWDRQFMGTGTVWFFLPGAPQNKLNSGEEFFWNVVLDRPLDTIDFTAEWTMIPEPSSLAMAGMGLLGLIAFGGRRQGRN